MSKSDPYVYDDTDILMNKLDIRNRELLEIHERRVSQERAKHPIKNFEVSFGGLKSIHRHLFGDIYEWAGRSRGEDFFIDGKRHYPALDSVISKGDTSFAPAMFIESQTPKYFESAKAFLDSHQIQGGVSQENFAAIAATHIGDINHAHPFRDGNGRTMRVYLEYLAREYGFELRARDFDKDRWMEGSHKSMNNEPEVLKSLILEGLQSQKTKQQETEKPLLLDEIGLKMAQEAGLKFVRLKVKEPGAAVFVEKMRVDGLDYALIKDDKHIGLVKIDQIQEMDKGQAITISPGENEKAVIRRVERVVHRAVERDNEMER